VSAPREVAEASSVDAGGRCTDTAGDVSAVWCDSYGQRPARSGPPPRAPGNSTRSPGRRTGRLGQDDPVPAACSDPAELHDRCTTTVVTEGERIGVLAEELAAGRTPVSGGLAVAVPWLPAWTVRDLVAHLGAVHRWATEILRAGSTARPGPASRFTPPDDDLAGWYATGLTELVAALRTVEPDAPAWHMSPAASHTARDWSRRQAHEHVVHRLDMEVAAGVPHAPVDPLLAADGVDELLGIVLPRWQHSAPLATGRARITVTAVDVDRCWLVEVGDGTVRTMQGRTGAAGDTALTGTAEQLLRRLWGRPADVTVTGDPSAESLLRGR
jgi:uncharacterized protein (TIGR03083 family)